MTTLTRRRTRFHLVPPGGPSIPMVPVRVVLSYDPADPYAVSAAFRTGPSRKCDIVWELSRELLAAGLLAPSGHGDIELGPDPDRPDHLRLSIQSPSGHAIFAVRATTVGAFLARTYAVVPLGAELAHTDLDGALAALLNEKDVRG